jgi:hypothetical protein
MDKKKSSSKPKRAQMSPSPIYNHLTMVPQAESPDLCTRQLKVLRLQHEIEESLSEILSEFLNDFIVRKERRLDSKNPNIQMHTYNLVVNKGYQKKIRKQVNFLISAGLGNALHEALTEKTCKFVDSLEVLLKELKHISKILQLIFLYDAYHTLQNAAMEIGKIISGIYVLERKTVDFLFCKAFYTKIVVGSQELLKQASDYEKSHFAIVGIAKMHSHLATIMREPISIEINSNIDMQTSESENDSESNECEPLYNLPIEELVTYIEGSKKKKKKSHRNTATSSLSPLNEDYSKLDKEVDEFRRRIDIPITPERPKLRLSQEFLEQLRTSLHNNKAT